MLCTNVDGAGGNRLYAPATRCLSGQSNRLYAPATRCLSNRLYAPATRCLSGQSIAIINQNGATSGFEMCFAPSTKGAGVPTKTRLEARMKKVKPHSIYAFYDFSGR